MDDLFEGNWSGLQCGGSPDIRTMLEKATVMIGSPDARQVSWMFGGPDPISASVTSDDSYRLWGQFQVGAAEYCYEIVARMPPPPFQKPRCLYGIVYKVSNQGPGGELGHPGTWVAEESGKDPVG